MELNSHLTQAIFHQQQAVANQDRATFYADEGYPERAKQLTNKAEWHQEQAMRELSFAAEQN